MTTLTQVFREGTELSVSEVERLADLEAVIEANFTGFVAVGVALAEIRDASLYREKCQTFEEYCQLCWDVNRSYAYRLIDSAKVVDNIIRLSPIGDKSEDEDLSPIGDIEDKKVPLPTNEAQARELAKLPPEEQVEVWQRLINLSRNSGTKITAKAVKKAVLSYKGEAIDKEVTKAKTKTRENRNDFQSEEFTEAFERFFEQVKIEKDANWRYTSRKTVFYHLQGLLDVVGMAVPGTMDEYGCAMELSEREKLKKAGFRIFRMDAKVRVIEEWHHGDTWTVHAECPTPKVLHDTFTQLLENHLHLKG